MAIKVNNTTVIDNSRNLTNIESVAGNGIATQAEAEAGNVNNQNMTPLRTAQAITDNIRAAKSLWAYNQDANSVLRSVNLSSITDQAGFQGR